MSKIRNMKITKKREVYKMSKINENGGINVIYSFVTNKWKENENENISSKKWIRNKYRNLMNDNKKQDKINKLSPTFFPDH